MFPFQPIKRKFDFFDNSMLKMFRDFAFLSIIELIYKNMWENSTQYRILYLVYYFIHLFYLRVFNSWPTLIFYFMDNNEFVVSTFTVHSNYQIWFSKRNLLSIQSWQLVKTVPIWKKHLYFVFECYKFYVKINEDSLSNKTQDYCTNGRWEQKWNRAFL